MSVVVRSFPTVRNAFPTVGNAKIIHDGTKIIPDQIQSYLLLSKLGLLVANLKIGYMFTLTLATDQCCPVYPKIPRS